MIMQLTMNGCVSCQFVNEIERERCGSRIYWDSSGDRLTKSRLNVGKSWSAVSFHSV